MGKNTPIIIIGFRFKNPSKRRFLACRRPIEPKPMMMMGVFLPIGVDYPHMHMVIQYSVVVDGALFYLFNNKSCFFIRPTPRHIFRDNAKLYVVKLQVLKRILHHKLRRLGADTLTAIGRIPDKNPEHRCFLVQVNRLKLDVAYVRAGCFIEDAGKEDVLPSTAGGDVCFEAFHGLAPRLKILVCLSVVEPRQIFIAGISESERSQKNAFPDYLLL